jgi:heat shock protein HslJ
LDLSAKKTVNYDVFNLLKEPVQNIYIMVPEAFNLKDISLNITTGEIQILNEEMSKLSLRMLSGRLGLEGNQFTTGEINITKTVFQSKDNHFQNLLLQFSTGSFKMENETGDELVFSNLYANGTLKSLNVADISITNNTGSFTADHITGDSFVFNTGGGTMDLAEYVIKKVTYTGTGIGNIGLTNGVCDETILKNQEGIISMDGLTGKVTVEGGRLNLYSVNQKNGSLDIIQQAGSIYISNDPNTENKMSSLKIKASDADVSVEECIIDNIDLALGMSIVTMNEVYGTNAKITVESGDLNFVNTDKTRLFDSFLANVTSGGRNVDVGVR